MSLNKTGKEVSKAKIRSIEYHTKKNMPLHEEYKNSNYQFTMSFVDFKKMKAATSKKKKK